MIVRPPPRGKAHGDGRRSVRFDTIWRRVKEWALANGKEWQEGYGVKDVGAT